MIYIPLLSRCFLISVLTYGSGELLDIMYVIFLVGNYEGFIVRSFEEGRVQVPIGTFWDLFQIMF